MRVGVDLWRRGLAPVVCVTGGHAPWAVRDSAAEAEGMARFVRRLGVPEECLRIDPRARSTAENAARAAELLLPEGRRRVWLATQPFHLRLVAASAGPPCAAPALALRSDPLCHHVSTPG